MKKIPNKNEKNFKNVLQNEIKYDKILKVD